MYYTAQLSTYWFYRIVSHWHISITQLYDEKLVIRKENTVYNDYRTESRFIPALKSFEGNFRTFSFGTGNGLMYGKHDQFFIIFRILNVSGGFDCGYFNWKIWKKRKIDKNEAKTILKGKNYRKMTKRIANIHLNTYKIMQREESMGAAVAKVGIKRQVYVFPASLQTCISMWLCIQFCFLCWLIFFSNT